jgi:hypothetical protein
VTVRALLALVLVLLIGGAALGRGQPEPVSLDDAASLVAAEAPAAPDSDAEDSILPAALKAPPAPPPPITATAAAPTAGAGRAHVLSIFRPPRTADARVHS